MTRVILALLLVSMAAGLWASAQPEDPGPGLYARISTRRGEMVFRLDFEHTPLTVINFCALAEGALPNDVRGIGVPYFNGMTFYRSVKNYALFAGDPTGKGDGGPGYTFPRETDAVLSAASPGILVMDGSETESSGSRFFITVGGDAFLDRKYTPFGQIVSGMDVLTRLKKGDVIESIQIIRDGVAAERLRFDERAFSAYLEVAREAEINALRTIDEALADSILALGESRQKTPSGIYYAVLQSGEGAAPGNGDQVSMHYVGTLLNGVEFDNSRSRNQSFDFVLGRDGLIPGWIEMVAAMQAGEIRKVVIPPQMGYGDQAYGPIAPNSWLIFEMELLSVTGE